MDASIKPVPGFPGYLVDDQGVVYSLLTRAAGIPGRSCGAVIGTELKPLIPLQRPDGRQMVNLFRDGISHQRRVHHIVLWAFIGPCPENMEACHFPDPDPSNNALSNLQWGTKELNQAHRAVHETSNSGTRNGSAKLDDRDVIDILRRRKAKETYRALAKRFGVSLSAIQLICEGKTWKHIEREG